MAKRYNRDHIEIFHDYGLFIPTRTIYLDDGDDNSVGYQMANRAIKNLNILASLSKEDITLIINTEGGDEYQGMAIYDAIRALKDTHVTAIVRGAAQSMGCIVLQAADKRIVSPNSALMFHTGSSNVPDLHPDEMLQSATFTFKYGTEKCDKVIYNRMLEKDPKLTWKKFRQDCIRSRYMFADEAVQLGLADEVESV